MQIIQMEVAILRSPMTMAAQGSLAQWQVIN